MTALAVWAAALDDWQMFFVTVVTASAEGGVEWLMLAIEEAAATATAAAAIADGAAMLDATAVPFTGFLAFDAPFLGGGTASAAEQLVGADSGKLEAEAPAAALADGAATPDAAALALDALFLEGGAAAAAEWSATPVDEAAAAIAAVAAAVAEGAEMPDAATVPKEPAARQIRTTWHDRKLQESIESQKASQCEGYTQQQTPVWEDHTTLCTNREIVETMIVFKLWAHNWSLTA